MRVLVSMPHYGAVEMQAVLAATQFHGLSGDDSAVFATIESSNLCGAFNLLWANALNAANAGEITHWAMLHADIIPQAGWLKILAEDMVQTGALFISAVSPIKDDLGLTSTGHERTKGDRWRTTRYTTTEVQALDGDVWTSDGNTDGPALLVNTGCMLIDMRNPIWQSVNEDGSAKFVFHMQDRMIRDGTGKWVRQTESEDWYFSRTMAEMGVRYGFTRRVKLAHVGKWRFRNDSAWGRWKTDEAAL